MDLTHRRILITGASGFIGGRLAERLTQEEGAPVRALVRKPRAQTLLSDSQDPPDDPLRDAEIAVGDVSDRESIREAVNGCDIVVHCAAMQGSRGTLDAFRRVNVDGTLALLKAARDAGIARFIHISTINVHGYPPPQPAHADSPLCFQGDAYSVSKAEGERAACRFAEENHLPLVVIRPGCTFGPRSNAWTLTPLNQVRRGAPVLIGGGTGICNAVYIDNLVDLILAACKNDAAVGQAFMGTEGRGVTWREFYGAYAHMVGVQRLTSIPYTAAIVMASGFEVIARFSGRPPRVSRASVEFHTHRIVFDISKSQKLLGYAPRISFQEGMRSTEAWLKAQNILPQRHNPSTAH